MVKLLLDKGVDLNSKDKDSRTALMWAAHGAHIDTVKLLLEKDTDPEMLKEGRR